MLKVSAWSGDVVVPLHGRAGRRSEVMNGLAARPGSTQQVNQVCPSLIAMLPEANSLPAEEGAGDLGGRRDEVVLPDAVVAPLAAGAIWPGSGRLAAAPTKRAGAEPGGLGRRL